MSLSERSPKDCATGFWDQSHFTKTFKHERGVTPGEYRRRHRTQAMS